MRIRAKHLLLAAAMLVVACESTTTGVAVGRATAMIVVSGDNQTGPAGRELPQPLVAQVLDGANHPVKGQVVNSRVAFGGGSVFAGAAISDDSGYVQELWTLGRVAADSQRLEARAVNTNTGAKQVFGIFHATATPGPAQTVTVTPALDTLDAIDATFTFHAAAVDTFGNAFIATASWSSSNTSVATINSSGTATAVANGSTTITATVNGKQGTALLVVV